jgi:hypothetical protein
MQTRLNQQISQLKEQLKAKGKGTGRASSQRQPIDLTEMPWKRAVEQHEYTKHWQKYPGDKSCPFHTVYCNTAESRAQQLKLGKRACANVLVANDMATGNGQHEDFTAQATPSQRHKIYKELKALEDAKEKACRGVTGEKLRELRVECTEKKREYKLNVFRYWQEKKHAAQISSAAVQMQEERRSLVLTRKRRRRRMAARGCQASKRLKTRRVRTKSESAFALRLTRSSRRKRRASRVRRKRRSLGRTASRLWRWRVWIGWRRPREEGRTLRDFVFGFRTLRRSRSGE